MRGAYEDKHHVHLVMEVCQGGELFDRIVERGKYTEKDAAEAVRTIVKVQLFPPTPQQHVLRRAVLCIALCCSVQPVDLCQTAASKQHFSAPAPAVQPQLHPLLQVAALLVNVCFPATPAGSNPPLYPLCHCLPLLCRSCSTATT